MYVTLVCTFICIFRTHGNLKKENHIYKFIFTTVKMYTHVYTYVYKTANTKSSNIIELRKNKSYNNGNILQIVLQKDFVQTHRFLSSLPPKDMYVCHFFTSLYNPTPQVQKSTKYCTVQGGYIDENLPLPHVHIYTQSHTHSYVCRVVFQRLIS